MRTSITQESPTQVDAFMGSKNKDATMKSVAMITQVCIETEKKLSLFVVFAPSVGAS
jgi:hypothetical protein